MRNDKIISKLLEKSHKIGITNNSKIIVMSDCHRGSGSNSDNFFKNHNIYRVALEYYYENGYTYMELGDGDELWANSDYLEIVNNYNEIFQILSALHKEKRFFQIFGNHDILKSKKRWQDMNLQNYVRRHETEKKDLFPNVEIYESILLNYANEKEILLIHGHQVDKLNSDFWKVSRVLVKYIWKYLELIGFKDPFSTYGNYDKCKYIDDIYIKWTKRNDKMLFAGHTHRLIFPNEENKLYFNDGCCVYNNQITGIEISDGKIGSVKWTIQPRATGELYVSRDYVHTPRDIADFNL